MLFNNILKDNDFIIINENEERLIIIFLLEIEKYRQALVIEEQRLGKE